MAPSNFPHLPLVSLQRGVARLPSGGNSDSRVTYNKEAANRAIHSGLLLTKAKALTQYWTTVRQERESKGLPTIKGGVPFLLEVPEFHDNLLLALGERFGLDVVAEFEEGFILVASEDIDLAALQKIAGDFATGKHGSAAAAEIIEIYGDGFSQNRIEKILVEPLAEKWPLKEDQEWILDVSIQTGSTVRIASRPKIHKKETAADFKTRQDAWEANRSEVYQKWDRDQQEREAELNRLVEFYRGSILDISQDGIVELPDSIACRIQMSGLGFNDLIQNNPHIFEVSIPEDIEQPDGQHIPAEAAGPQVVTAPSPDSATICVIDSGIQEGHRLISPAIDRESSRCFVPGKERTDVADEVSPNGHGTCVAGAILYPREIAPLNEHQLPFWIQNARLLNELSDLPDTVFPPSALRNVVMHYRYGPKKTRIFNHSISANGPCGLRRMSAWAAEIDFLSYSEDVLIIQAVGNIDASNENSRRLGIVQHLHAGRDYPDYLNEASAKLANPSQSLQAITVGSISLADFNDGNRCAIASAGHPSSFTRTGFGMWNSIKPELVELGGDYVRDTNQPPGLSKVPEVCPELIRSTLTAPGSAYGRVAVGTSFAVPRVTAIVGALNTLFPTQSTLLYRALLIQSARWPSWAENASETEKASIVKRIGYGFPDLIRATENNESRVTLVTDGLQCIHAREAAIYAVEIPEELRRPGSDFDIRVEVTLSYSAQPRRSRSSRRGYLAVWLDWISSNKGETLASFKARALKDQEGTSRNDGAISWTLGTKMERSGQIDGVCRQNGTVQKDWATIKSYELPEFFAIAIRGHAGWSTDPTSAASFALAVTIEAVGQAIPVYNLIRDTIRIETESETRVEIQRDSSSDNA